MSAWASRHSDLRDRRAANSFTILSLSGSAGRSSDLVSVRFWRIIALVDAGPKVPLLGRGKLRPNGRHGGALLPFRNGAVSGRSACGKEWRKAAVPLPTPFRSLNMTRGTPRSSHPFMCTLGPSNRLDAGQDIVAPRVLAATIRRNIGKWNQAVSWNQRGFRPDDRKGSL